MSRVSPLATTAVSGSFGNFEGKSIDKIIKISEVTNTKIYQVVQYKASKLDTSSLKIDSQILSTSSGIVSANLVTRIQWNGPKVWTIMSSNINILDQINASCSEDDFAITDLSHSRAIIQIEGENTIAIIKKGCPLNLNEFAINNCANSVYHGMAFSIDMINDNPSKFNLMVYRSFADSFYHAITDASLEYGYIQE
jgi:sarcosine oxidase subunit gamma